MKCPVHRGNYSINRYPFAAKIPDAIPDSKYKVYMRIQVQVTTSRKLIEVFSLEVLGRFKRV